MARTGATLMAAAGNVLTASAVPQPAVDGPMEEFAQSVCEAMAGYGSLHLDCLTPEVYPIFIQQA